jgi:hypothetical protein
VKPIRSLRLRLFAFAAIVVAAALLVTGFSLSALFSRHVERRVGQELDTHINQLIGGLRIDAQGLSLVREPVDPRFQAVFGGLYWQVNDITAKARFCAPVRFGTPISKSPAMCSLPGKPMSMNWKVPRRQSS